MADIYLIVILAIVTILLVGFLPIIYFTFRENWARLGKFNKLNAANLRSKIDVLIEEVLDAVTFFHRRKIGCLIVFRGKENLSNLITDEGVAMQSSLSADLIKCVFVCKEVQLHDGVMLIDRNWKIEACSVFFRIKKMLSPGSENKVKRYGTRHLVAQQIAFNSDAAVIVVSETHGQITYIHKKKLTFENIKIPLLRKKLKEKFDDN